MDKVRFDVWLIWPQTDHTAIKNVSGPVIIVIDCSTFPGESKTVKPLPTILCPYFCAICIHCLTSTLWHSVFSSTLFFFIQSLPIYVFSSNSFDPLDFVWIYFFVFFFKRVFLHIFLSFFLFIKRCQFSFEILCGLKLIPDLKWTHI